MPYFPVISCLGLEGKTTVYNFPPNNWEKVTSISRFVNLSWASGNKWKSLTLDKLKVGSSAIYSSNELAKYVPEGILPLLSLSNKPLQGETNSLLRSSDLTRTPEWRATIELCSKIGSSSYQGEIQPFRNPASLLIFPPFIQKEEGLKNYLLFINAESSPHQRTSDLDFFTSAKPCKKIFSKKVKNNSINCIDLNILSRCDGSLPILACKEMTGLPLFLTCNADFSSISLEHTHPPGSIVVHGNRLEAQKQIKSFWLNKLY